MQPSSEQFDPYFAWLGIDPAEHPLHHYSLLGLPPFTSDVAAISRSADERMQHVRQFQTGPRGAFTQKILNELSSARICLTSSTLRAQYDAQLHKLLAERAIAELPPALDQSGAAGGPELYSYVPVNLSPQQLPVGTYGQPLPPPGQAMESAAGPPPVMARGTTPPAAEDPEAEDEATSDPARWPILLLTSAVVLLVVVTSVVIYQRFGRPKPAPIAADVPEEIVPEEAAPAEPAIIEMLQEGSGEVNFTPSAAIVEGSAAVQLDGLANVITGFADTASAATWNYRLVKPGFFQLEVTYRLEPAIDDAALTLVIGDQTKTITLRPLESADAVSTDRFTVAITRSGKGTLRLSPKTDRSGKGLTIESLKLIPVGSTTPGSEMN